ncbi:MAG: tail fiber domain-containing protein [Winogradskyella sp.]|uniref:tail fiber domain-containing protein n=1 Tax=Winogradskyella sp. TaxID=1883156 RepID=UPI00385A29B3
MKFYSSLLFILIFSMALHAQVGIGTTAPNGALDITSATDGLLIPQVALTNLTTLTVVTPTASEIVYNTTSNGIVEPGYYYLLTATGPWVRFGGSGWLLDGNTGVTAASFIGSINDADVSFRRFNLPAGRIGTTNTSLGLASLSNNVSGNDNTAIGTNTLSAVVNGIQNVAVGYNALTNNAGSANIGIGWNAGAGSGTSFNNIAIGFEAMINNAASNNIAIGFQAMRANVNSPNNMAIGFQALANLNNAAANSNVAVGFQAMQNSAGNISGTSFFGTGAGRNNTGNFSTGLGMNALGSNNGGPSSGIFNTSVGYESLSFNTSGQQNTAVGADALYRNTTGSFNTGIGYRSGEALTSGASNTMLGYQAGNNITVGSNNTAVGFQAQVGTAGGSNQIRIGNGAITLATTQVAWTTTSDRRWKENITDASLGLDFLQTLRPVSYIRNNDEKGKTEYGFIAQELEQALINVGDKNNGIISKDDAGMYGVRYNDFISITVKAVQEQQALIETLQKQNEELVNLNSAILKRLEALEKKQ